MLLHLTFLFLYLHVRVCIAVMLLLLVHLLSVSHMHCIDNYCIDRVIRSHVGFGGGWGRGGNAIWGCKCAGGRGGTFR